MSNEDVETVRRMYDAFYAGDVDATLKHFDRNVLVDPGDARPDLGVGKGREYLATVVGTWAATFDEWRDEIVEMRDLGSRVLVIGLQRGRGKGSRIDVEARYAMVYDVAGGVITTVRMYGREADALEATGLSE